MKISGIETIQIVVPIAPDRMIVGARGPHDRSPFLIVRVRTDEGLEGLGEVSCTPRWSGEDSVTARHVCDRYLEPVLLGQDPRDVERLTRTMTQAIEGHHFTKAAVEMALWDLLGKALGVPVYSLLGGLARPGVRTKFSVAAAEPARAAEIASWACAQGFGAMKVKVGTGLAGDLSRVAAVRSAIGDSVRLGVDANGGWSRAEAAAAGYQAVQACPLRWRGLVIGAINVFFASPGSLVDEERQIVQAFADIATVAVLQMSHPGAGDIAGSIRRALATRAIIEQAKGVLAAQTGLSIAAAFDRMLAMSDDSGTRLETLARQIIDAAIRHRWDAP